MGSIDMGGGITIKDGVGGDYKMNVLIVYFPTAVVNQI